MRDKKDTDLLINVNDNTRWANKRVIEIAFASAVGGVVVWEEKKGESDEWEEKGEEVLSMMYLCTDAESATWRKYSIRRRSLNYLARVRPWLYFLAWTSGNALSFFP